MKTLLGILGTIFVLIVLVALALWQYILILIAFLIIRRILCGSKLERHIKKVNKFESKYHNRYDI